MQGLQHEAVAAQRHEDVGRFRGAVAVAPAQPLGGGAGQVGGGGHEGQAANRVPELEPTGRHRSRLRSRSRAAPPLADPARLTRQGQGAASNHPCVGARLRRVPGDPRFRSMSDTLRIALAQLDPHQGQVVHNLALIRRARAEAARQGADLVVTPEFSIAGYPPEDLVLKPAFVAACRTRSQRLRADTADGGPALIVGAPWRDGGKLYNAASLLDGGRDRRRRATSIDLPNYGVFDEKRVFDAGPAPGPVAFRGVRLGVLICEDMWTPDVVEMLAESGAEILLVDQRLALRGRQARRARCSSRVRAGRRERPAVRLSQPGGRPGRAGVRRRLLRARRRPLARACRCRISRGGRR